MKPIASALIGCQPSTSAQPQLTTATISAVEKDTTRVGMPMGRKRTKMSRKQPIMVPARASQLREDERRGEIDGAGDGERDVEQRDQVGDRRTRLKHAAEQHAQIGGPAD